jgi:hypothetical protein
VIAARVGACRRAREAVARPGDVHCRMVRAGIAGKLDLHQGE